MGSAVILVLQVVCLVLVIVAIVNTRRALRNVEETRENTEKAVKYMRGVKADMEGRFKEMEDTISALRRGTKKKGGKNVG